MECLQILVILAWNIAIQLTWWTRQPNTEIGSCWYQQGTNNKWTYDLTNHLIVDLETIIALASMTYTRNFDGYMRHPGDKNVFNKVQ